MSKRIPAVSGALMIASALIATLVATTGVSAGGPLSGAIFTTNSTGSEVNMNIYPSKDAVYLDGGPGLHAPIGAAGLPDGTYVFQVTDPSGKTLLSSDNASCRQVTVSGGIFSSVAVSAPCAHNTGSGADGSVPVQLMPYADTPNNGGEYKAWVTPVADFVANCQALGVADGLGVVDCGSDPGNQHGFIGSDSKTDNFKVKSKETVEIDTQFRNAKTGQFIDGPGVTWSDTHGASNRKWSYNDPAHLVYHQAHVEAPEVGKHHIFVDDQAGCTITSVGVNGVYHLTSGPQDIVVTIKPGSKTTNIGIVCG